MTDICKIIAFKKIKAWPVYGPRFLLRFVSLQNKGLMLSYNVTYHRIIRAYGRECVQ